MREKESKCGGGAERDRRREKIPSRLCTVNAEPNVGLEPEMSDGNLTQSQESDP